MAENVLFVDDSKLTIKAIRELFAGEDIVLLEAANAEEALQIVRLHEVAVVVSDNIMPGMNGVQFLSLLKGISPDTVKILMSAFADLSSALEAINTSEVFRFVLKPFREDELMFAVKEGLRRYRMKMTMRKEDEDVLLSLAQTIELKDPSTRGHCDRVGVYATRIAHALGLPHSVQREIKYGSWLHDCGKIGIAEDILNGPRSLTDEEFAHIRQHAEWGEDVAVRANLSQIVRNIVRHHHERYDGMGYPDGLNGDEIPLEARIVSVADIYDALITDRPYREGYPLDDVCRLLLNMRGAELDPAIVDLFLAKVQAKTFLREKEEAGLSELHDMNLSYGDLRVH
jgi:response regulator RpfG family c-di-GMP phosphodiesterase